MIKSIPIKIKGKSKLSQQDIKNALNLNEALKEEKPPAKKTNKFWLISTSALALIALILAVFLFLAKSQVFSQYQKLIPKQSQAVIFLKIDQLKDSGPSIIPEFEKNSELFRWLKDRILQFLADAGVNAQGQLIPLFKEDLVFLTLPSGQDQKLKWLILAETKGEQEAQKQAVFDKIEQGLKKEFGANQLFYRQIKINSVYSLGRSEQLYFYAQVNNFISISNDLDSIKEQIDRIIGR